MAAPSPADQANGLPSWAITLAGRPMDATFELLSVEVRQGLGRPSTAQLAFADGDATAGTFPLSESAALSPGTAVTVSLGYDEAVAQVFSGVIERQGLEGREGGRGQLIVEAAGHGLEPAGTTTPVLTLTWGQSILDFDLEADVAVRGQVLFQGSALPVPGCTVALAGLGSRFNGDAIVSGVHQRVAEGLWTTRLDLGSAAPHRVGRLRIEAAIEDDAAPGIRERLEQLAGGALATALERAFDGLGLGSTAVKLDRLDLQLGAVRPETLEADVLAALERTLPGALRQALAGRQAP
ncbi:MAG: Rhs element Vgr protein [Caulobacter sp.]|nr:Rhs element Vgr protein [Caulobacter sp.]